MAEKTIMIVDDQYGIRTLLTEVMQHDGFLVVPAGDGDTALELYRKHRPAVVLIDIRMPRMDGIELMQAIKKDGAQTYTLAMTAFDLSDQEMASLQQLGVQTIYKKPFDLDQLRAEIAGCFQEPTTHVYNKLVRDRIPHIIEQNGKACSIKKLDDAAYERELRKKLQEEWQEYVAADHDEERAAELADVLEVIYALAARHGVTASQLEAIRRKKAETNGAFADRLLLLEVTEQKG